jgi:hypothetical protein
MSAPLLTTSLELSMRNLRIALTMSVAGAAAAGALLSCSDSISATVIVDPDSVYAQWATGATASTQYSTSEWSAFQATGMPNADGCNECNGDDPRAWEGLAPDGVDWLELTYARRVRPTEIRIYEVWGVGLDHEGRAEGPVRRVPHRLYRAADRPAARLSAHSHYRGQWRNGDGLDRPGERRPEGQILLGSN